MKQFKAIVSTILLIFVIGIVVYLTIGAPLAYDGTPIIPSVITAILFAVGFWTILFKFYNFMNGSKTEKAKKEEIFNNLILYPLPKILNSWEVGSFTTKESKKDYTTFRFYINSDILYAVFMSNLHVEDYKKILIGMEYKEFKELDQN